MGRNLKILVAILFAGILYGIYYFVVPFVLNSPDNVKLLESIIQKESGFKTKFVNPKVKMGIFPAINFDAKSFEIINDDGSDALKSENLNLNVSLFPLLVNHFVINNFSADKVKVNLVFDSKFKLGQYDLDNLAESNINISKALAKINNYDICLNDKIAKKQLKLDGQLLNIEKNKKHFSIITDTELNIGNKKSIIKANIDIKQPLERISENGLAVSGQISDLDLSDFSSYAESFSKNKIKSLYGILNFSADNISNNLINANLSIQNLGIIFANKKDSIVSRDEIKIDTIFAAINNGLELKKLKISGKDINANVFGKIKQINNKFPTLDLNINITRTLAENVIKLLPPVSDLVPDVDLKLLKETGFWGEVSGNLQIKGKADYPNVYGSVLIANAYMVKPIINAKKATIKLLFKGDKFDLDVVVPTSSSQTVWVKGPINLDAERSAVLHITSTDSVDLKTAQIVLNPLHKILNFDIGPVPIMDIKGLGGIDLKVVGTRKNPHAWGKFFFKNATVSFLDIHNMNILNGSGELIFEDENTKFKSNTALLNGSPVSVQGTCSLLGNMDFNVEAHSQDLGKLLNIIKSSPMLVDVQKMVAPVDMASGLADLKINLTGQVKDIDNIVFNKNLFAKGAIILKNNFLKLKDAPYLNVSGKVNFNNTDASLTLKSLMGTSHVDIDGLIKDNKCNLLITSNKFNLGDAINLFDIKSSLNKDFSTLNSSFIAKYNGKADDIELDKLNVKGKIYSNNGAKSSIILNNTSNFELVNSNLKISALKGIFNGSPYNFSLNIMRMFSKDRVVNGYAKIESFDLTNLNGQTFKSLLPDTIKNVEIKGGKIDLTARSVNNRYNVYTSLNGINMSYDSTPLTISGGNLLLHDGILNLNKLSLKFGDMPIFADGKIYDIFKNPNFNLYLNLKPNQNFADQFFNKNSLYPIKLKGDVIISSKIKGTLNNLSSKSIIDIKDNSSIYYMGAMIGNEPVKIDIDSIYRPNNVYLKNLKYDKIIMSQNNKPFANTQLNASGNIKMLNNNILGFNNFKIKTENPTDAKVFNILFRKPFVKQGLFTSNLVMNGTSINPKIIGSFSISGIDIPFFDSTIRDINIDFKNDKITLSSKGKVLTNDVNLSATIKNNLTPPYVVENLKINLADLNVNRITEILRDMEAEATKNKSSMQSVSDFDLSQLVINNANIDADKIHVRNINAENFSAHMKLDNTGIANLDSFKFDIAEGNVFGSIMYDIKKDNVNLDINLKNANALIMSEALFDLKGQVYGSVNGDFKLSCNEISNNKCFKTLSGNGKFEIANGRMPKLGSLEYLLKAGNIFKSGIAGFSINSLIDLVTPLKTGDFQSISGDVKISNGVANKINIYSSGSDLNMYMSGSYNISNSIANMKLLGSLSKNITTVFGKIKNASLNTLFNTIPGVNDSTEKLLLQEEIGKIPNIKDVTNIYRIFAVDVNGDINGADYVKSFRWVK